MFHNYKNDKFSDKIPKLILLDFFGVKLFVIRDFAGNDKVQLQLNKA